VKSYETHTATVCKIQTVLMFTPLVHALESVNSQDNGPKLLNYLNGKLTCAADIHKLLSLCVKSSMFSDIICAWIYSNISIGPIFLASRSFTHSTVCH